MDRKTGKKGKLQTQSQNFLGFVFFNEISLFPNGICIIVSVYGAGLERQGLGTGERLKTYGTGES